MAERLAKSEKVSSVLNLLRDFISSRELLIPPLETKPIPYRGSSEVGIHNYVITGFKEPTMDTKILNKEVQAVVDRFGPENSRYFKWMGLPFRRKTLQVATFELQETVGVSKFHLMALPEHRFTDPEAKQYIGQQVHESNLGKDDIKRIIHVAVFPSKEVAKLAHDAWSYIQRPHAKIPNEILKNDSRRRYLSKDSIAAINQLQALFYWLDPKSVQIIWDGIAESKGLERYMQKLNKENAFALYSAEKHLPK